MKTQTKQISPEQVILNGEKHGSYISTELADFLKKYTTKDDRDAVSRETGVGVYTVRNVANRSNTLTEDNQVAVLRLSKIAIENCKSSIDDLNLILNK